jgi:hypothetical protein
MKLIHNCIIIRRADKSKTIVVIDNNLYNQKDKAVLCNSLLKLMETP